MMSCMIPFRDHLPKDYDVSTKKNSSIAPMSNERLEDPFFPRKLYDLPSLKTNNKSP